MSHSEDEDQIAFFGGASLFPASALIITKQTIHRRKKRKFEQKLTKETTLQKIALTEPLCDLCDLLCGFSSFLLPPEASEPQRKHTQKVTKMKNYAVALPILVIASPVNDPPPSL
jgi:hypothetical protein